MLRELLTMVQAAKRGFIPAENGNVSRAIVEEASINHGNVLLARSIAHQSRRGSMLSGRANMRNNTLYIKIKLYISKMKHNRCLPVGRIVPAPDVQQVRAISAIAGWEGKLCAHRCG